MTTFPSLAGGPGDHDTGAQARTIFDALDAGTTSFSEIARLRLFYTAREDFAPLHAVRQPYFRERLPDGDFPATTGVITGGDGGPSSVLAAEAILGPGKASVFTPEVWTSIRGGTTPLPVSHGCTYAGVLLISGQVAYDLHADVVGRTLVEQTDHALANFEAVVREAGRTMADVACFTVYVVAAAFGEHAEAVAHFERRLAAWTATPPVVVWVGVQELFQPGLLVEIEATVALGEDLRRTPPRTVLPGTPDSALATTTGDWAFAVGSAPCADADGVVAAVAAAFGQLEDGLGQLGTGLGALGRVTAWCDPAGLLGPVAAAVTARAPGLACTAVRLTQPKGAPGRIVLEAVGHGPSAGSPPDVAPGRDADAGA